MVFDDHTGIHILNIAIDLWVFLLFFGLILTFLVVIFFIVTFRVLKTNKNREINKEIKQFQANQSYQTKQNLFEQHIMWVQERESGDYNEKMTQKSKG